MKEISKLLKTYREVAGLSQSQVAKALGSDNTSLYSQYELGLREPKISQLERLLNALGFELTLIVTPEPLTKTQTQRIGQVINDPHFSGGENTSRAHKGSHK